ncbi:unnamed protein product [Adineta steineri]|uniref:Leucine-rich repeat-containing protein 27 n=1 Tax=Adineta steineri TaxID=433720 RepID=A0A819RCX8_9BILA|nr:unnamed protein product [Adineta steineri]CAF4040188.1 unnamed protein product [Adineta steineri]
MMNNDLDIPSDFKNDAVLYIDNTKENSLTQLITKAQQQGFNCLDLSKRNIDEFPSQILEFTSLQYLYLEGNQLTQLPSDLFIRLPNLKWLDLRNNQLTSIPHHGLAKHSSLQYLLLSGNLLQKLPFELGKVKTLSALNLDGNPLHHPPIEIIKQGIKAIQQYLRDRLNSDNEALLSDDDNDDDNQQRTPKLSSRKSNFKTDNNEIDDSDLPPLRVQSCKQYERTCYSSRHSSSPSRSQSYSGTNSSQVIRKTIPKKYNDLKRNVYTTQEQPLEYNRKSYKDRQQLHPRNFIKSKEKPVVETPLLIHRRYTRLISKDQLEFIKNLSSDYIGQQDEIRRKHDRQNHDHIRQITDKMLKRRLEERGNLLEERRHVKCEIQELHRLVSAGKQHRPPQVVIRPKTSTGEIKSSKKL